MIILTHGNIFNDPARALVIPVNCEGVAGAGLALEAFRLYPDALDVYRKDCRSANSVLLHGGVLLVRASTGRLIVCAPTKIRWRDPSNLPLVYTTAVALAHMASVWRLTAGLTAMAVPALGCGCGGLNPWEVMPLMVAALSMPPEVTFRLYCPFNSPWPWPGVPTVSPSETPWQTLVAKATKLLGN